jgi:hypothetical protein
VSLALALRDKGLPMPGAILAVSAWFDMEMKNKTLESNAETDASLQANVGNVSRVVDRRHRGGQE